MRAKLLKILRRDAERAIETNEFEADGSIWISIYRHGKYLDRCQGSSMAKESIRIGAYHVASEYRRAYILEKLEELK